MTKAELILRLERWPDNTVVCIGTPCRDLYKGVDWNDIDTEKTYGMKAGPLKDGTPFLKQNEFYLWPTEGRVD